MDTQMVTEIFGADADS
jgi:hypothetical protein